MSDNVVSEPAVVDAPAADPAPVDKSDEIIDHDKLAEEAEPEPKPEPKEPADKADASDDDDEGEGEDGGKGRRLSRSQRQARKIQLLATENAELRRLAEGRGRPNQDDQPRSDAAADDPKPPKETDFAGDYLAYERALHAFNTEQAVARAVDRRVNESRQQEQRERQAEIRREALLAHQDRVDEAKERIPDFEKVLKSSGQAQVAPQVVEEILDSEKSALLQYYLAQNPDKLKELNGMSGRELAREIGRLEGRVHLPKPKIATEATPPLAPPRGGAAAPVNLETADMESYVALRMKQQEADRRR